MVLQVTLLHMSTFELPQPDATWSENAISAYQALRVLVQTQTEYSLSLCDLERESASQRADLEGGAVASAG